MNRKRFDEAIRLMYKVAAELESAFPGRHFTPDGHMVGSIGEAIASEYYGVSLYSPNTPRVDGEWSRKPVQVKAAQGGSICLKEPEKGDLLLVLYLKESGAHEVVYFNDALAAWRSRRSVKPTKAGGKFISLKQLHDLGLPRIDEEV